MEKYQIFLSTNGNLLFVPKDGSHAFFLNGAFHFERYVSKQQVDYYLSLKEKMPEICFVSQTSKLPSANNWYYLFKVTEYHYENADTPIEIEVHVFGRGTLPGFQLGFLRFATNTEWKPFLPIGALEIPAETTLYGKLNHREQVFQANDGLPLEELNNFRTRVMRYSIDDILDYPIEQTFTRDSNTASQVKRPPNITSRERMLTLQKYKMV